MWCITCPNRIPSETPLTSFYILVLWVMVSVTASLDVSKSRSNYFFLSRPRPQYVIKYSVSVEVSALPRIRSRGVLRERSVCRLRSRCLHHRGCNIPLPPERKYLCKIYDALTWVYYIFYNKSSIKLHHSNTFVFVVDIRTGPRGSDTLS